MQNTKPERRGWKRKEQAEAPPRLKKRELAKAPQKQGKERESRQPDDVEPASDTGGYGKDFVIDFALAAMQYAERRWYYPDDGLFGGVHPVGSGSEPDDESDGTI